MSTRINRREFGSGLVTFALASLLYQRGLANDRGMEELDTWLAEYLRLGKALGAAKISQEAWQNGMDRLFLSLQPADLLKRINFDAISQQLMRDISPGQGELFQTILLDGRTVRLGGNAEQGAVEPAREVVTKIAYVEKGRCIPPHGHSNMVSAFLHLSGEFRVRQFNKLADEVDALVVRPSTDLVGGAGSWSSMSDTRNNVHWLTAKSEDCFLFTAKVVELDERKPNSGRINIDVRDAQSAGRGAMRVPKISDQRARELYNVSA
jgi:hypothetical protein